MGPSKANKVLPPSTVTMVVWACCQMRPLLREQTSIQVDMLSRALACDLLCSPPQGNLKSSVPPCDPPLDSTCMPSSGESALPLDQPCGCSGIFLFFRLGSGY